MNFYKATTMALITILFANAFVPTLLPDTARAATNAINCITVGAGLKPAGQQCADFTLAVKFTTASAEHGNATSVARGDHNHDSRYLIKSGDTMVGDLSFGATTRQMISLFGPGYGIGIQNYTFYNRTDPNGGFAWYAGGTHSDWQNDPGTGGTRLLTMNSTGLRLWNNIGARLELGIGKKLSLGGNGSFEIDAPSVSAGRFVVTDAGNVGIGRANPDAKLHVVTTSANVGNNTAELDAPNIGPNASHIHWGTTGDWYIRSAADGGKVVIQDNPGNVGIGTQSPGDKLTVAGTVNSTSGGFKFPDGSVQTKAAGDAYSRLAIATDPRNLAGIQINPMNGTPNSIGQLNLPAGEYLVIVTADFNNNAGFVGQDNSRRIRCQVQGDNHYFTISGDNWWVSTSWHQVVTLTSAGAVDVSCVAMSGGTDYSYVYANTVRLSATKVGNLSVQP